MVKPLAIAAVIVAVLGWIAVPNLLHAMQRSHQKRSLADMRTIATAWEARATDMKTYAIGAKRADPADDTKVEWNALTPVSYAALQHALEPKYLKSLPVNDAWGRPFEFVAGDQTYAIRSLGRDGRADEKNGVYTRATTKSFDADIVYANGAFMRTSEEM
jgi:type II secretory pathway pseudopilin PulG